MATGWLNSRYREAHLRHARRYARKLRAADERYSQGGAGAAQAVAKVADDWGQIEHAQACLAGHWEHDDEAAALCSAIADVGTEVVLTQQPLQQRLRWADTALRAVRRTGDRSAEARHLNHLGLAWAALGEYQKAIEHYERALAIDRKVYGDAHPSVATGWNNLGDAWRMLGEPQKAIEHFERALAIFRQVYGDAHPDVARVWNNLGLAWAALGEPQKAIEHFERALAIFRQVYGDAHPDVATGWNNLGLAWHALGEPQKAIEHFERALTVFEITLPANHPNTLVVRDNLASAQAAARTERVQH